MGAVAERISLGRGCFGKALKVCHFKGEVSQIDLDGSAGIVLTKFDLLLTLRGLKKDQFGATTALAAASFFQAKHITVEGDALFQIMNAVTGMEEFGDHG